MRHGLCNSPPSSGGLLEQEAARADRLPTACLDAGLRPGIAGRNAVGISGTGRPWSRPVACMRSANSEARRRSGPSRLSRAIRHPYPMGHPKHDRPSLRPPPPLERAACLSVSGAAVSGPACTPEERCGPVAEAWKPSLGRKARRKGWWLAAGRDREEPLHRLSRFRGGIRRISNRFAHLRGPFCCEKEGVWRQLQPFVLPSRSDERGTASLAALEAMSLAVALLCSAKRPAI